MAGYRLCDDVIAALAGALGITGRAAPKSTQTEWERRVKPPPDPSGRHQDSAIAPIRSVGSFIIENRSYIVEPQPLTNILVLRKVRDDDRHWQHFKSFDTSNPA